MIIEAILKIDPNAQVSVNAEDLNQITWHDGNPNNITVAQIEAKMAELPTVEEETAQIETDKSSGKQKLKDLGLTEQGQ